MNILTFDKLHKLIKIANNSKISLSVPKKKVIFFDFQGFEKFKNFYDYILEENNYFVLRTRVNHINKIYLSLRLIFNFFIYIFKVRNLKIAYLISLILEIKPKIVITNIDNSIEFSIVAKNLYGRIRFLAIQNAARYEFDEPKFDYKVKKDFFIPEFACFSEHEIIQYKKHDIKVKKFHIIGSLNLSQYIEQRSSNIQGESDICLILEESTGWDNIYKGFEDALGLIASHTVKFAEKNNLKLVFAGKREESKNLNIEKEFYRKYLKKDFRILKKTIFSSYDAIEKSKVSIGMISTLLREGLALKKKILSCNFTDSKCWDFPISGICSLTDSSYERFEERMNKILTLNFESYTKLMSNSSSYLMHFDINNPPKKKLKDIVLSN